MSHTSETLRDAFHYLYRDELPALKELAQSLPASPVVVNIGSGAGTSGLAFLESRPDLWLITIDKQNLSSPFGCLEAERVAIFERFGLFPSDDSRRYSQVIGDSVQVAKMWPLLGWPPLVDLVFIDGDHSYGGCAGDILGWLPHLKIGGILAVHDYQKHLIEPTPDGPHPKPWPEVDRAVDEFLIMGGYEMVLKIDSLIAFRVK